MLGRFIADSPPGKVAAGAGPFRYYPFPSGPAPSPTVSVRPRGRGLSEALLNLTAEQVLDHAARYPLPGGLSYGEARLLEVRFPLRDLVAGKVHQVEGLGGAV
jgi:hypothetical protein